MPDNQSIIEKRLGDLTREEKLSFLNSVLTFEAQEWFNPGAAAKRSTAAWARLTLLRPLAPGCLLKPILSTTQRR